jgi:hypothetical protein
VINVIRSSANTQRTILMTPSAAASEGKKIDEGTMMSLPEHESNLVVVADPPDAQALTPTTAKQPPSILTKFKI